MILIIAIAAVAVIGLLAIGLGTVGIQNKKKKKVLAKRALEEAKANKAQEQSPIIINNNIPENAQQSAPVAAKAQEFSKMSRASKQMAMRFIVFLLLMNV